MAIIPNGQQFNTVSASEVLKETGSAFSNDKKRVYSMQDIADTVGGVDSKVSVYVKADGTPQENGVALLAAYADAAAKSTNNTTVAPYSVASFIDQGNGDYLINFNTAPSDVILKKNYYANYGTTPAQELIYRINNNVFANFYSFFITDIFGNPALNLTFDTSGVPVFSGGATLSTLIVGPGQYDLPSDLVTGQDAVSIVSLTGERDVHISGADIKVSTESNAIGRIFSGLDLGTEQNFFIEDGLTDVTFKNIKSRKTFSFGNVGGGGNMSGTFIDCEGGSFSFASHTNSHASGTFINCKADTNSFGSLGITSGFFEGCFINASSPDYEFQFNCFGESSVQNGGTFINCTGRKNCFGSDSENVIALYENCRSYGDDCFGSSSDKNSGTFINCHVHDVMNLNPFGKNFGSASTSAVDADTNQSRYYYCTATGDNNFGAAAGDQSSRGTYIGCISEGSGFGSDGVVINCVIGSGSYTTSGSGIIRNSIDGSYNTINLN